MLVEMKEQALLILSYSWPMVVITVIVAATLRIAYFINNKQKVIIHEELFMLIFVIYILCLFQAVTYQDVSFGNANFIPFREIFRYHLGTSLFYKNILGNVLLFLPYGFFIVKYTKTKSPITIFVLALVTSFSIEIIQLLVGRVFDVDDIILNVVGAMIGYYLIILLQKINNKIPEILKKDIILDILSILLIGGFIWFLIP